MTSTRTYSTRADAISAEIVDPIIAGDVDDAYAAYDIEALADAVLGDYAQGYRCLVTADDFWLLVEAAAR